jgi:hypothetical protein
VFSLARELGMTVGELERRMDSRELTEWMALRLIENGEAEQHELEAQARANARMI